MKKQADFNEVAPSAKPKRADAFWVGLGILGSRFSGLIRERVFAHYFGNSLAADCFKAALKIPNFLQNLFGEGVLSASFIPVYANLIARNERIAAQKVAGAIATLLACLTSLCVLVGVRYAPFFIDAIAPGFEGEKRDLTIKLVQIFFPGTGLLVMSAWCLGILNSHRRFFLSYIAPVVWNGSIIGAIILFRNEQNQSNLAIDAAYGLVVGSFLQFVVQVPLTLRLLGHLRLSFSTAMNDVRIVIKNFVPVVFSRGVVQVSAYVDNMIASLLPTGAVSSLAYAQTLYLLPVSLFGMSITASQLPTLSSATGTSEEVSRFLQKELDSGLRKIAFFIVPCVVVFVAMGDVFVAAFFQTGSFTRQDTLFVWFVLIGSTVGLLASTLGRLYSSTFYALRDTRTPVKFAIIRVINTTILGYVCAVPLPRWLGIAPSLGTVGIAASAGVSGWIEFLLLRKSLNQRIGKTGLTMSFQAKLWGAALLAGGVSLLAKLMLLSGLHPILKAGIMSAIFGCLYFLIADRLKVGEAKAIINKLRKKIGK